MKYPHGLDIAAIRRELDEEDWQPSSDDPGREERCVFLGTVFALMPSGKYYMPWACSNVAGDCKVCKGSGINIVFTTEKRVSPRRAKKIRKMLDLYAKRTLARCPHGWLADAHRLTSRLTSYGIGWGDYAAQRAYLAKYRTKRQALHDLIARTCKRCDGTGSQSAADDERWREAVEKDLGAIGAYLMSGEGDPCDLFAGESRDTPEAEYRDAEDDSEVVGGEA